ncbi:hypothetical protein CUMW_146410 [Citrus unshiu]|uniref:Uncharacterized protein n=1 Tax=Citrus sinensis TaxID=2711 RepID=A0A067GG34_CITSI|nr:hypothetical protein CISIN_1g036223mg [Citrus sinensis]GAY53048.1 hypothetical protein CUMW_146410 [Citrus unshiu]
MNKNKIGCMNNINHQIASNMNNSQSAIETKHLKIIVKNSLAYRFVLVSKMHSKSKPCLFIHLLTTGSSS